MFVCGWLVGLPRPVELTLHRRHVDDVLVAPGVRSMSGLRRALKRNGATALTRCTSSSSTVGTSASGIRQELWSRRSTCWSPGPGTPPGMRRDARESSGSSGTCESSAEWKPATAWAVERGNRRFGPSRSCRRRRAWAGRVAKRGALLRHHVRVELRRPPDGLAGVVDDEVEAVARGGQLAAERFHAGGVAQVEPGDLEPVSPVAEIGLGRVAGRRVPRKARGDDEVRARAEELEPRLVADLHAAAGQQRHSAPRSASSVRAAKLTSAHAGQSWS